MHWNPMIGLPLVLLSLAVLALIYVLGRPRAPAATRSETTRGDGERIEPRFADGDETLASAELPMAGAAPAPRAQSAAAMPSMAGAAAPAAASAVTAPAATPRASAVRVDAQFERIVTLFVAAREGQLLRGMDIAVAAEKVGLQYGEMGIFHRLDERSGQLGPVFSVANMVKPGRFDLDAMDKLQTPGLGFFMTLPGPLSALDAWDAMHPTAQRMAELLDGVLLDGERNALSRQGLQHMREDLRQWDRRHDGEPVSLRTR